MNHILKNTLVCAALLISTLAGSLKASVTLFVDSHEAWRKAIGEPITEIDWYPHWLPDGDLPQSTPIPVEYYSDLGLRTGIIDPAFPEIIIERVNFDSAFNNPNLPPFYMAFSSGDPDPDGAHMWFSEPIHGFQSILPDNGNSSYGFFPVKFYLDGNLVGETFNLPQAAQDSLGIVTDFAFDHVQAVAVLGRLELPTMTIGSDCPDINGDLNVNVSDVLAVIDQWGLSKSPADVNTDGIVNVSDLLMVVGHWGPCA